MMPPPTCKLLYLSPSLPPASPQHHSTPLHCSFFSFSFTCCCCCSQALPNNNNPFSSRDLRSLSVYFIYFFYYYLSTNRNCATGFTNIALPLLRRRGGVTIAGGIFLRGEWLGDTLPQPLPLVAIIVVVVPLLLFGELLLFATNNDAETLMPLDDAGRGSLLRPILTPMIGSTWTLTNVSRVPGVRGPP